MTRVFATLVLAAIGVGGCAQRGRWVARPVPEAGSAGELAAERLRTRMDVAIANLANLSTYGHKPTVVLGFDGMNAPVMETRFMQGSPVCTQRPLDVCIHGEGFFRLSDERTPGGYVYSRLGRFTRNADSEIVLSMQPELRLEPRIVIPVDAASLTVDSRGVVSVSTAGSAEAVEIGRIELSAFVHPGALNRVAPQLYQETARSGPAVAASEGKLWSLLQFYVEGSAVDPRQEQLEIERIRGERPLRAQSPAVAVR